MDIQLTQRRLEERQRVDTIRKIFALMSRNNITINDLDTFEDQFASVTPRKMIDAAKQNKPTKLPKPTETKTVTWSI